MHLGDGTEAREDLPWVNRRRSYSSLFLVWVGRRVDLLVGVVDLLDVADLADVLHLKKQVDEVLDVALAARGQANRQ